MTALLAAVANSIGNDSERADIVSSIDGRPEYGEYATPEEQAAAMGTDIPVVVAEQLPVAPPLMAVPVASAQPRRWDRILTIALLAMGTIFVISSTSTYADLPYSISEVYALYGFEGTHPDAELANSVGLAINIVQVVLLIIAIVLSWFTLRRGRLSFYIPLVAGVLANIVGTVLLTTLLLADPSFVDFMQSTFS
jgi:hypothetical protein